MAVREVIEIDEERCDGCGECVTSCAEGAIAIIDGKARLISDVYCDGLGACLGHCPQGALKVIEREAEAFDERAVEEHLARLREPTPTGVPPAQFTAVSQPAMTIGGGCPGSRAQMHQLPTVPAATTADAPAPSRLRHWPVQLHLVPPTAPFFQGQDVLLAGISISVTSRVPR